MPKNNIRPPRKIARSSRYARRHPDEEVIVSQSLANKWELEIRDAAQGKPRAGNKKNAPR